MGSPRASQIPWSGCGQASIAASTCRSISSQMSVGTLPSRLRVQVDRVDDRAPDVVLALVEGAVADPHRARALIAGEVVEGALGQVLLAADPVHDLQLGVLGADADEEAHEVARLLVEAEGVHRPEREGGVADPAVAVVPVALAAGGLGQRGGRRGDDRAGRSVGEALQHQGRALQVDAPGMVGEVAVAQPLAPELAGRLQPLERLGGAARAAQLGVPVDRAEADSSSRRWIAPRATSPSMLSSKSVLTLSSTSSPRATANAQLAAAPGGSLGAVGEAGRALELQVHLAVDAVRDPQQRAVGLVPGWGRPLSPPSGAHSPIERESSTSTQPVSVTQVVSMISVPGSYRRLIGTVTPFGQIRKWPASRSSSAAKALGESKRGTHSHSTAPS